MRFDTTGGHAVELRAEPMFTPGSADDVRGYGTVHRLDDTNGQPWSTLGVVVTDPDGREVASCALRVGGGGTGVHAHSAVVTGDVCHVAVGDNVVALRVPTLDLLWATRADPATCFGLHRPGDGDGLIVHGELSISRLSPAGELVWQAGGADIFTGPFAIDGGTIRAEDWDGRDYRIATVDGRNLSLGQRAGW